MSNGSALTPQQLAVKIEQGDVRAVAEALRANPSLVSAPTPDGDTPLHIACWQQQNSPGIPISTPAAPTAAPRYTTPSTKAGSSASRSSASCWPSEPTPVSATTTASRSRIGPKSRCTTGWQRYSTCYAARPEPGRKCLGAGKILRVSRITSILDYPH